MTFSASHLGVLAIAFFFGVVSTAATRRLALRLGFVSKPNPIVPQHTRTVAYLGGFGVAFGAVCALATVQILGSMDIISLGLDVPRGILWGGVLFLALGIADDLHVFSAILKFGFQIIAAGAAVASGLVYAFTGLPWIDAALSLLWILIIVNALNLTDVCDGLVGGLSVIMLVFLAACGILEPVLALAFCGALMGFLIFNLPPARIFLGDAGSHLLGFVLASGLLRVNSPLPGIHLPAMLLFLSVPLFELGFLTVIRMKKGLPWWKGSPDHFSLRLQAAGCTRLQTDLIAWYVSASGCLAAILFAIAAPRYQLLILAVSACAFSLAWKNLLKWEVVRPDPVGESETKSEVKSELDAQSQVPI